MSMALIQIEQHTHDAWVAEVEVGGMVSRREIVRASTFDGVMAEIARVYRAIMPPPEQPPIDLWMAERAPVKIDAKALPPVRRGPGRPRRG